MTEFTLAGVLIGGLIWAWYSLHVIKEGERGVVLRLGKIQPVPLAPGLRLILWPVDALYRVSVEPQKLSIAEMELVARGDAAIKASATCSFRVADVARAISQVQDYRWALNQLAQERMRQEASQFTVEDFLYAPEKISEQVKQSLEQTAGEWGLDVLSFEVQCETH